MVYTTAWSISADQLARACEAFSAAVFVVSTRVEGADDSARLVCDFQAASMREAEARVRILKHELLYADVDCTQVEFID